VTSTGERVKQGGHQNRVELDARLAHGWRAVADLNQLSSLTFRLVFAETFDQAARSEVRSTASLTNNFRGFSLGFAMQRYKNFLSAVPERALVLRSAPAARISSVEQAPWRRWPVYFGFHASVDAVHRSDPQLETPDAVQRSELAPRITIPLRWGPWLGVSSTFALRTTRYSISRLAGTAGAALGGPVRRNTGEITVDIRPPSLARVWETSGGTWKHVIEPKIIYRYVNGVNEFGRFLRFDENDLLTDTNEVEYSLVHRFFRRSQAGTTEVLSWRVTQKYYLDETFGGALVPGQRNVFQALYTVTPFAFADQPRHFSPIVSDLKVTPGGRYDAQFRLDYDTTRSKVTAIGTLVKMRPYRESFLTLAHFATRAEDVLQPLSNQIRALAGYGDIARRGWNFAVGLSYDVNRDFFQNTVVQVSYNGSCCGIGFEFRRLALGPVRSDNQFRVSLLLANIGTFGTVRRQEKLF
jgi:LPS-assembly protein